MMTDGVARDDRGFASELKFVLNSNTAAAIRAWARRELEPDPHARRNGGDSYRTTSLYFDTDDFDTFFGRGSFARAKYRIRRYDSAPNVFLERKLKFDGRVAKRRTAVPLEDLTQIAGSGHWPGDWFARRLLHRRLRPVCQVTYSRMARIGMSPAGQMRLTIDRQLAAVAIDGIAFSELSCVDLMSGQAILELKYRGHMPAFFKRLIADFRLEPNSISKYRRAVWTTGLAGQEQPIRLYA